MGRKAVFGALGGLVLLAAGCWFAYRPLLARYRISQLESANESDVARSIARVAALGDAAVPRLLTLLEHDGPAAARAGKALSAILDDLSENDQRAAKLADGLCGAFVRLSPAGKQAALEVVERLVAKGVARDSCRGIVRGGLTDAAAPIREFAISLAIRSELALEPEVLPLLHDPEAGVRRSAVLAIGSSRDLLSDDELLPWLHDPDAEVSGLCETALRARGLRDRDIHLGRLLTDPSPLKRLQVIDFLPTDDQIDPRQWLQRLSQDPVPIVRAGAARAALDPEYRCDDEFRARIRQMAMSDPDGTVRQIADGLLKTTPK
jgi:hypothetical protein